MLSLKITALSNRRKKLNSTEEKIIAKAISLIQNNDYTTLSLRKIAKMLGMTTGAFYKHFKDKDDLFYRMSIELSRDLAKQLSFDDTDKTTPFEKLVKISEQFCLRFETQPHLMTFLFFNPSLREITYTENNPFDFLNLIKNLISQVNHSNTTDSDFFIQIWSFIQGYSLLIKNKMTRYDAELIKITLTRLAEDKN